MSHKSRSFASSKNESPSSFARLEPLAANANGPSIVSTAAVVRPRAAAFGRDAEVVATARRRAVALGPFPLAAPRLRRETGARPTRAQRRLAGRHRLLRDSRVPRERVRVLSRVRRRSGGPPDERPPRWAPVWRPDAPAAPPTRPGALAPRPFPHPRFHHRGGGGGAPRLRRRWRGDESLATLHLQRKTSR